MSKANMRQQFIRRLAEYLAGTESVRNSIKLQLNPEDKSARDWLELCQLTPLLGYPTIEEAEKELTAFLTGGEP